jgi:transposase-like protein
MIKRRNKTTMYRMIQQWKESGMSQSAFCTNEKLSESLFYYWHRKYKQENRQSNFLPIKMQTENKPTESNIIEIHYPNQVRLVIQGNTPIDFIRQLTWIQ